MLERRRWRKRKGDNVPEFMYLFRGGEATGSPQQLQKHTERWIAWMKQLADSGCLQGRGAPLDRRSGRLVRGPIVTDGPYAEKDVVAGFVIVEARDFEHAVELAAGHPIYNFGGLIEVREVLATDVTTRVPKTP